MYMPEIKLYSLIRVINGERYAFNVPCESFEEAEHLALRIDCTVDGEIVEETEVCINCYTNPNKREVPIWSFVKQRHIPIH